MILLKSRKQLFQWQTKPFPWTMAGQIQRLQSSQQTRQCLLSLLRSPEKTSKSLIVVPYLTADAVNTTSKKKPSKIPTGKDFIPVVPTTVEKFTKYVLPANVDGSNGQPGTALHK
jgi:hypothetical protein